MSASRWITSIPSAALPVAFLAVPAFSCAAGGTEPAAAQVHVCAESNTDFYNYGLVLPQANPADF